MLARSGWLAIGGLAAALPAAAQVRPQYLPTRDVAVEYRLESNSHPGAPRTLRIIYAANGERMRVEAGRDGYSIIDRVNGRMMIVMAGQKSYLELKFNPEKQRNFLLSDKVRFARLGSDTVAGLPCTLWQVEADKHSGTACLTADGVMLRGEAPNEDKMSGRIVAVAVNYGPQPPSLFTPPAGYSRLAMPRLPPGMVPGVPRLPH
jgi:uncharacterized protein DUF4412